MTSMKRRTFLKSLFAATVVVATPSIVHKLGEQFDRRYPKFKLRFGPYYNPWYVEFDPNVPERERLIAREKFIQLRIRQREERIERRDDMISLSRERWGNI